MSANGLLQIALFLGVLLVLTKPLGWYMARIYEGRLPGFVRWIAPLENLFYRLCGVDSKEEMRWTRYALAMLWFALLGCFAVNDIGTNDNIAEYWINFFCSIR